jgi:hypothetical protein
MLHDEFKIKLMLLLLTFGKSTGTNRTDLLRARTAASVDRSLVQLLSGAVEPAGTVKLRHNFIT